MVVSQPPVVSEVSVAVAPAAGGAVFLSSLPSVLQDLARFFFVPVKILFPGSDLRYCGWGWVWVPLCPLTSAAGAVTFGAATAMPAGAGDSPAARCCAWRAWSYAVSGGFPL